MQSRCVLPSRVNSSHPPPSCRGGELEEGRGSHGGGARKEGRSSGMGSCHREQVEGKASSPVGRAILRGGSGRQRAREGQWQEGGEAADERSTARPGEADLPLHRPGPWLLRQALWGITGSRTFALLPFLRRARPVSRGGSLGLPGDLPLLALIAPRERFPPALPSVQPGALGFPAVSHPGTKEV